MNKTSQRNFGISYDEVITKAQSMQPQYLKDQAIFSTLDPAFTVELGTELLSMATVAMQDYSATSQTAAIQLKTEQIVALRDEGADKYQKLLYYVHTAFGKGKGIDNTFGRKNYEKARRSEKEMVALLRLAAEMAESDKFKTSLVAKGLPEGLTADMITIADDLTNADHKQEMLKKEQLVVTSERIELYNGIWDILVKINTASKVLFQNDPARLAIYQLYEKSGTASTINEPETEASSDIMS